MCDYTGDGDGFSVGGSAVGLRASHRHSDLSSTPCMKCREQPAQVLARQLEPLCYECLATQLQTKAHNAIKAHGIIAPGDAVMLAFSGGIASAALLHLLMALRNPRSDRLERKKVAFTLHIVHVDELAAWCTPEEQHVAACAAVRQAAEQCLGQGVHYHCVALEGVFAPQEPDPQRQRQRLQQLVQSVPDLTGREDLVAHLRTHRLLAAGRELGCGKVARGDCATRLAAHIMAAASKGCGYGLPGDVQLVDARYGPSNPLLFYPLWELGRRELAVLCQYKQLPTVNGKAGGAAQFPQAGTSGGGRSGGSGASINSLAAGFVEALQANNPGTVSNIVRTISKLQAFPWNDPPELHIRHSQQRQKSKEQNAQRKGEAGDAASGGNLSDTLPGSAKEQQKQQHDPQQEGDAHQLQHRVVLCPLCLAPLADDELALASPAQPGSTAAAEQEAAASSRTAEANPETCSLTPPAAEGEDGRAALPLACCVSCRSQILGLTPAALQSGSTGGLVGSLLPEAMQQQMRRLAAAESCAGAGGGVQGKGGQAERPASAAAMAEQLRSHIAEFLLEDSDCNS